MRTYSNPIFHNDHFLSDIDAIFSLLDTGKRRTYVGTPGGGGYRAQARYAAQSALLSGASPIRKAERAARRKGWLLPFAHPAMEAVGNTSSLVLEPIESASRISENTIRHISCSDIP